MVFLGAHVKPKQQPNVKTTLDVAWIYNSHQLESNPPHHCKTIFNVPLYNIGRAVTNKLFIFFYNCIWFPWDPMETKTTPQNMFHNTLNGFHVETWKPTSMSLCKTLFIDSQHISFSSFFTTAYGFHGTPWKPKQRLKIYFTTAYGFHGTPWKPKQRLKICFTIL